MIVDAKNNSNRFRSRKKSGATFKTCEVTRLSMFDVFCSYVCSKLKKEKRFEVSGYSFKRKSRNLRKSLRVFLKNRICVACGVEGTFFVIEYQINDLNKTPMLNLYGYDNVGELNLITVDHIVPRSKGGGDCLDNLQTMCYCCNSKKADKK